MEIELPFSVFCFKKEKRKTENGARFEQKTDSVFCFSFFVFKTKIKKRKSDFRFLFLFFKTENEKRMKLLVSHVNFLQKNE